ncbi:MAG: endolytic transglycosylase MltG [Clostridium sp.]|nr:endolytic transglycosylase MltG [Clostridium sp.]
MAQDKSKKKKKKKEKHGWFYNHPIATLFVSLCVVAVAAFWILFGFSGYSGERQWLYVQPGATNASLRDSLKSHLGMIAGNRTYLLWRLQKGKIDRARGMYLIENGTRALQLSRRLTSGRQSPIRLSFNGYRTIDQTARRIASQMEFSDSAFLEACDEILAPAGFKPEEYPAAIIPDTYEFYITDPAEKVVRRLLDERNRFWDDERVAKAHALGLTPVEVATIASIAEEETAKADERPKIARLYMNRVKRGMRLQADPTVKFGLKDFAARRVTLDMVRTPSPYNTYLNDGLPPGPIRVAERRTLDGVLNAPSHSYIYMCAKSDFTGYHDFSSDYATHQANAARYHKELNKRNIKR